METLLAELTSKAGAEEEVLSALRELVGETAREPGAVDYQIHRAEGGTILVFERYVSAAALEAHLASPYLAAALRRIEPLLARPPALTRCARQAGFGASPIAIDGRAAVLHVLPFGPARFVVARAANGVLGCGALDPAPLQRLGIAAARVKPTRGRSIADGDDLLAGEVREVNELARARGVEVGMAGAEALRRLA